MKHTFDPIAEQAAYRLRLHNELRRDLIAQGVDRLSPTWFANWENTQREERAKWEAEERRKEAQKTSWPIPEPRGLIEFIIYRPAPRGRWDSKPATPAVERVQCGFVAATTPEEAERYAKVVWGEQAFCVPKEKGASK